MDICLYASHYGTAGATRENYSEEIWAREVVAKAVDILRNLGFDNVYTGGLTGHEIDQHQAEPNLYDVCISNHFNSGNAMLLFNQNRNNQNFVKINNAFSTIMKTNGIVSSGAISRPDLAMLNSGNSELYLLEWADCNKANELQWLKDTDARARDLENLVRVCFLDGKTLEGSDDESNNHELPTESKDWKAELFIGKTIATEQVLDFYDESGWYHFTKANKNPIYPSFTDACLDSNIQTTITVGESVQYKGVILGKEFNYIVYDRDNGQLGVIAITNKTTGWKSGYAE